MRWARYLSTIDGREHAGLVVGSIVYGLRGEQDLLGLIQRDELAAAADRAQSDPWEKIVIDDVKFASPIACPPSIRDFMSFEEHVVTSSAALDLEVDPAWYEQPTFYFTNPAAVHGPTDDIPIAPGSAKWDFELEVAAVIGRGGRDIPPAEAEDHIVGYTILCDWSARDLQEKEMRVGLGPAKGKDSATTLGPFLVTPDELEPFRSGNGYDLAMSVEVNGRRYSSGTWSSLYWSFPQMIAYASRGTSLRPGDVIGSGTVGTGCILELSRTNGLEAFPWLVVGDEVRVSIEMLGSTVNTIVPGSHPHPL